MTPATARMMRIEMSGGAIEEAMRFAMRPWIGSCAETAARMSGHLDGDLPVREERLVRRHLAHCRRCRQVYESLLRAVEHLRAVGRDDLAAPVPSIADAVIERVRRERR